VLQIIETATGRASTSNGLVWHIEALTAKPPGWGSMTPDSGEQAWLRCGMWSERDGLVESITILRSGDSQLREACQQMIEVIRLYQGRQPFDLVDRRELWLLDEMGQQPLALLYAMRSEAVPPHPEPRHWSGSVGQQGLASQQRFPQIDQLELQVRKRAGFSTRRRWVSWNEERTLAVSDKGERFSREDFPECGLLEEWPEPEHQARVRRYIEWIAPALLTLPYLSDDRRAQLEARLAEQALSIEYHWRLYPKMVDERTIKAARVQATLMQHQEGNHE
jgi:hypothetical protein